MSLRTRIDRLAVRNGGRSWIEPAGEDADGVPMQAHVFEHPDGRRFALVVPVPCKTTEEWAERWAQRQARCVEAI